MSSSVLILKKAKLMPVPEQGGDSWERNASKSFSAQERIRKSVTVALIVVRSHSTLHQLCLKIYFVHFVWYLSILSCTFDVPKGPVRPYHWLNIGFCRKFSPVMYSTAQYSESAYFSHRYYKVLLAFFIEQIFSLRLKISTFRWVGFTKRSQVGDL